MNIPDDIANGYEPAALGASLYELERTLIPHGLHVLGQPPRGAERDELIEAMLEADPPSGLVIASAKSEGFCAGADLAEVEALASAEAKLNPRIRDSIGDLAKVPVARRVTGPGASWVMAACL